MSPLIAPPHFFSENHCICGKYEKVLDQDSQYIVHEHMNIQEKSSKWDKLSNVILESLQCTPYKTNHSSDALQFSNQKRLKPRNTKEVCKYNDSVNSVSLFSTISLNQGIHMQKKKHNRNAEFEKVFVSKHKVMVKRNNTGVNPYKCSEFDKYLTQREKLQSQQRIYHGKKPYKSSKSDKCFTHQIHLSIHQGIYTEEKIYKCSECDKCFKHKFSFSMHQRIHTGEKPYKCSECDKCFTQKSHLSIHQRIHTGEKPYK